MGTVAFIGCTLVYNRLILFYYKFVITNTIILKLKLQLYDLNKCVLTMFLNCVLINLIPTKYNKTEIPGRPSYRTITMYLYLIRYKSQQQSNNEISFGAPIHCKI